LRTDWSFAAPETSVNLHGIVFEALADSFTDAAAAVAACNEKGGYLAAVDTDEKEEAIKEMLNNNSINNELLIGLSLILSMQ